MLLTRWSVNADIVIYYGLLFSIHGNIMYDSFDSSLVVYKVASHTLKFPRQENVKIVARYSVLAGLAHRCKLNHNDMYDETV